jgi:hypothetical protein
MIWLRRFFTDLFGAYLDGFRVARALPWLFVALVAWEFVQHVVEVRIGFFESEAASRAVAQDTTRIAFGWVKMLLVYVGGFFAIRYLAWGDGVQAMRPTPGTLLRYAPYVAYAMTLFALVFHARSLVAQDQVMTFRMAVGLAQMAIEPLLILWIVSAATSGAVRGPLQSARLTGWLYIWALLLFFVGRIPINAAHQLLNKFAIGQPEAILWPMLVLDSVVVGLLIFIVPALYVRIARFIAERPAPAKAAGRRAAIGD